MTTTDTATRLERALRSLRTIQDELGNEALCENLGLTEGGLSGLMAGEVELDEAALGNLEWLIDSMEDVGMGSGLGAHDDDDPGPGVDGGLALDRRGEVDEEQAVEHGMALPVKELTYQESRERRKGALWRARNLAIMTQFRLDLSWMEQVNAMGAVTQFELALIMCYGETLPEAGGRWDGERRNREVQRRLARLRWVERQRRQEGRGVKGVINWFKGQRRVSGKEMYQKMMEEADGMEEETFIDFGTGRSTRGLNVGANNILAQGEYGRR